MLDNANPAHEKWNPRLTNRALTACQRVRAYNYFCKKSHFVTLIPFATQLLFFKIFHEDYRTVLIWNDEYGFESHSSFDAIASCGTRCLRFVNYITSGGKGVTVVHSSASMYKYNPSDEFYSQVWKKGNNGDSLGPGLTWMEGRKWKTDVQR